MSSRAPDAGASSGPLPVASAPRHAILEELFSGKDYPLEIHNHRDIRAGHLRGSHLEFAFPDVVQRICTDPVWQRAWDIVEERRTLVSRRKLVNLFLILSYGLPFASNVIEFGSYRGGSALFMASVLRDLGRKSKVYALDTYAGMPATDPVRDSHGAGEFADCDDAGFRALAVRHGLENHLQIVKGRFEDTLPRLLSSGTKFALAHVDCDIYSAVKYATQSIKAAMQTGGYIVFDDPLHGSCLGAFDAVAETLIQEDRLVPEQVYPHLVFRYPPLQGAG